MPSLVMPSKSYPRQRHLTRSEAALLLWASLGFSIVRDAKGEPIKRADGTFKMTREVVVSDSRRLSANIVSYLKAQSQNSTELVAKYKSDPKREDRQLVYAVLSNLSRRGIVRRDESGVYHFIGVRRPTQRDHLRRLILIGLYTGTRPGAILSLHWMPTTMGGYVNLDNGVIYRKAEGERVAHNKRKTPVKMARSLAAHMARWKRLDNGLLNVIHYNGEQPTKINKAFRALIADAGLTSDVTPHVLRHTRGTWLAQANVPAAQAAASLGMTEEEYERTYLHNDPTFQEEAANAY